MADGQFAGSREVFGGFFAIAVPDWDRAARAPGERFGRVRPVADVGHEVAAVEAVFREEHDRLLVALARRFGDLAPEGRPIGRPPSRPAPNQNVPTSGADWATPSSGRTDRLA